MELEQVAHSLYGLAPEGFTTARDTAAKDAPDRGTRDAVRALRRPSVAAWLVNLLARNEPGLLGQLLDLGPALAQAQAGGRADELRALGTQRRELVAAVTDAAVQRAGRPVTASARTEVEATLEAALADPASAQAVRSGHLVRALSYAGFGDVDLDGAVAAPLPPPAGTSEGAAKPSAADSRRAKTERARAEAQALAAAGRLDDAVRACEHAEGEQSLATTALDQARDDVEGREAALVEARDHADQARRRTERTIEAAQEAVKAVRTAQAEEATARSALDALRRSSA